MACRASVAVIFTSAMAHSKTFLTRSPTAGAAAGLSQQDQMLIAACERSPTSAADAVSTRALGKGVPIWRPRSSAADKRGLEAPLIAHQKDFYSGTFGLPLLSSAGVVALGLPPLSTVPPVA